MKLQKNLQVSNIKRNVKIEEMSNSDSVHCWNHKKLFQKSEIQDYETVIHNFDDSEIQNDEIILQ